MSTVKEWLVTSWPDAAMVLVTLVGVYIAIIVYCRIVGLRSFSKMSAFDFSMTVAVGSILATSITAAKPTLLLTLVALAGLFAGQLITGIVRRKSERVRNWLDNEPLLLMRGSEMLQDNMKKAQVTTADIYAKLREANVLNFDQIRAVVMENTGDVSVLHSMDEDEEFDEELLDGVRP